MKVNANTLKPGNIIEFEGRLCRYLKGDVSQPGKGGAFLNAYMRDIETGTKVNTRFRTQESVEKIRLDQEPYQFLFKDGEAITLMHTSTYEQITVQEELFGDAAIYLQDGMEVEVESYEGKPLSGSLPDTATFEIVEAEPVVKGQTATTSYKPAVLDNGARVMVPPHIESGTRIVIKTEDGTYVEKAKD